VAKMSKTPVYEIQCYSFTQIKAHRYDKIHNVYILPLNIISTYSTFTGSLFTSIVLIIKSTPIVDP